MESVEPLTADPPGIPDSALMLKFQDEREFSAFEALFERHKQPFMQFLQSLTGERAIAEDLSQHCWLKLIELAEARRYRPGPEGSFRSFLYTMGRNRYLDEYVRKHEHAQRASVNVDDALEQQPAEGTDPQHLLASEQGQRRLLAAVAELPFEQREVIALWASGTSIAEMVAVTGALRETVLSRKKYALAKLKARLFNAAEDPP